MDPAPAPSPSRARRHEWVLVVVAFAALVAVASVWLASDRRPPEWDHANHLERAVTCARDLARGDLRAILERSSFYPPLVPCTAGLAYRLWPSDVAAAQAVILAFLGLGMGAVFLLGRAWAGAVEGVVAALVFGTAPFVVFSALRFQLDLPLAAIVALTLVLLLRADGFGHRGWSLAAGVALGLGMLTKPPFALYVLPLLAAAALRIRTGRALANALLALLAGGVLALPWYGMRITGLAAEIDTRSFRQAAEAGQPDALSAQGLLFYPTWAVPQLGLLGVVLAAIGLLVAARRRRWGLLASLLIPFAVFALLQNKNLRYTLPLLPVAAALAGLGVGVLPWWLRRPVGVGVLVVGALQVSMTSFAVPHGFEVPLLRVPLLIESPPDRADWRQREILAFLARDGRGAPATVSVVPNHALFSVSNFRYFALRDGRPFRWERAWDGEPVGIEYMILKTGDQGPAWTAAKPRAIAERFAADPHLARVFPVVGEWALPDGSIATVRARRIDSAVAAAPSRLGRAAEVALKRRLADVARDVVGLEVRVLHGDAIRLGRIERVEIGARAATVGELGRRNAALLRVHDLGLVVDDVLVNPWSLDAEGRLDPLDARRVRLVRATILAPDLAAFFRDLKGYRQASVGLERGALAFVVRQPGPAVSGRARFLPSAERPFELVFEGVRLGGVPVPGVVVDWVVRGYDPSLRLASRLPVRVEIGRVEIAPDAVRISPAP